MYKVSVHKFNSLHQTDMFQSCLGKGAGHHCESRDCDSESTDSILLSEGQTACLHLHLCARKHTRSKRWDTSQE